MELEGDGTQDSPYLINDKDDFKMIDENPYDNYKLVNNICLDNEEGYSLEVFEGVLDGNGFKIKGCVNNQRQKRWAGLIIRNYGTIKNLIMENMKMRAENRIGGITAINSCGGHIENCIVRSSRFEGTDEIGGIAGENRGNIRDCSVEISVSKSVRNIGGIAGYSSGIIKNCTSKSYIDSEEIIGGIVGRNTGKVVECFSESWLESDKLSGGIVGINNGIISKCKCDSIIYGIESTGGIVGENLGRIRECFSGKIPISKNKGLVIGGITGINNGVLELCYCMDKISQKDEKEHSVASIACKNEGKIRSCYWLHDERVVGIKTDYGESEDIKSFKDENKITNSIIVRKI